MKRRLVIDGNAVYEIDEECVLKKLRRNHGKQKKEGKEYETTENNKDVKEKQKRIKE